MIVILIPLVFASMIHLKCDELNKTTPMQNPILIGAADTVINYWPARFSRRKQTALFSVTAIPNCVHHLPLKPSLVFRAEINRQNTRALHPLHRSESPKCRPHYSTTFVLSTSFASQRHISFTTGLRNMPMRSISTSTTFPGCRNTGGCRAKPTPGGVPVKIKSPRRSVHTPEI
jgi:hypothetical protein